MNGIPRLLAPLSLVILLGGCGPLGVGLGLTELFNNDQGPDLVNPTVAFLRASGAAVGPFEMATSVTFRIVRNKSNIAVRALVVGPGRIADAGALDTNGCPDVALFDPEVTGGELVLTGLQDLAPYTVYLRGVDPDGRIDCVTHTFFVDTQAPASPVILRVDAKRARELNVIWARPDDAGSGVAGYRVYYDVGGRDIPDARARVVGETYIPVTFLPAGLGGSAPVPVVGNPDTLSFTLKGLLSTRMHYIQVTAVDAAGNESPLRADRERQQRTRAGGDGTFEAAYAVGLGGTHAGVGDVNGDGALDVVVLDVNNNVKTAFGALDATGRPSRTFVVGDTFTRAVGIALGDVTGNHRPELVPYDGETHSGDFGFRGLAELTPGQEGRLGGQTSAITRVRLVDLNRDGVLDLMRSTGTNVGGAVEYRRGASAAGRATGDFVLVDSSQGPGVSGPSNAYDFATADFDGDGLGDIAVTFDGSVRIGLHTGQVRQVVTGGDPFGVAAADFNRDGFVDIATANRDGSVSVVLGSGGVNFGDRWEIVVGTKAGRLTVGDFDEDTFPDLVVGDCLPNAITILRGNGDGTFTNTQTVNLSGPICQTSVRDMTGDGIQDLVVLTPANTHILPCRGARGVGNGKFTLTQAREPSFHAAIAGDFNGDGVLDVAGTSISGPTVQRQFQGPVSVSLGTGTGGAGLDSLGSRLTSGAEEADWVASGDFDGDGNLDLVTTGPSGGELLRGLGNGGFQSPEVYFAKASGGPARPFVSDFDGDGALDVVRIVGGDAEISFGDLDNGKPNGKVREIALIGAGRIHHLAVADLNDDNRADLVAVTSASEIEIFYSNGDGTFADPEIATPKLSDSLLGVFVVDVDGDPIPDLIVNDFEEVRWVLRGKADAGGYAAGAFETPIEIALSGVFGFRHLWTAVTGDVNGDGKPDVLMSGSNTGDPIGSDSMLLRIGDGKGNFTALPGSPTTGYAPILVDLDGDRILDIVTGTDKEQHVLTGSGTVVGD